MDSYYNTNAESGARLGVSERKALSQEAVIERFFRLRPRGRYGPADVQDMVLSRCPITSIRRAITNLTTRGILIKTDHKHRGKYGKQEHTWQLAAASKTLFS